ncbi:flagella synthesis protein FlgN [Litoribrevibacter euphylliae]|uniref:Flagella synthesis protein FlgN n=1 Tax=Litoribrevibacter euphylliae TaxID=1834034 RepID=A0ABV7HBM5_9GAMM
MSENIEKAREIILHGIDDDLITLSEMRTLLTDEKTALESRDIDAIKQISEKKSELSDVLTMRANKRTEVLSQFGLSNDESGIYQLFEGAPRNRLDQAWPELKIELKSCQDANEINSKIASRIRHSMQQILKIIQGKSEKPNLYNPLGSTAAVITGNLIGEA